MFTIFKKEFRAFFSNATGYIVTGIFLLLTALLLWVIPGQYNIPENGYAQLDGLFYLSPWLFLLLCPAITMRFFAEEKQTGTWELLTSKPLSKTAIVAGKFLAGWALVLVALIPMIFYYLVVYYIAEPQGNVDSGAFWGSFIGLVFLAGVYISIGIFSSSFSNNQIISFVTAVVISFFMLYGYDLISNALTSNQLSVYIQNLGINLHYKSISRGVIDSRDLTYFFSVILIFLYLTQKKVSKN